MKNENLKNKEKLEDLIYKEKKDYREINKLKTDYSSFENDYYKLQKNFYDFKRESKANKNNLLNSIQTQKSKIKTLEENLGLMNEKLDSLTSENKEMKEKLEDNSQLIPLLLEEITEMKKFQEENSKNQDLIKNILWELQFEKQQRKMLEAKIDEKKFRNFDGINEASRMNQQLKSKLTMLKENKILKEQLFLKKRLKYLKTLKK